MRFPDTLGSVMRNMTSRPLRGMLTAVAVGIGAFTLTITSGLGTGINTYIDSQTKAVGATDTVLVTDQNMLSFLNERPEKFDDAMVSADSDLGTGILSDSDIAEIRTALGAEDTILPGRQVSPLYVEFDAGPRYRFVYNGYWPGKTANLAVGEQLSDDTTEPQIVIPTYLVPVLGFPSAEAAIGKPVDVGVLGQDDEVREISAVVVGVQVRSLIGGNLPFGNKVFNEDLEGASSVGAESGTTEWFASALVSGPDVDATASRIRDLGFAVQTPEQIVGDYKTIVSAVLLILNVLAGIAIIAAMFGIVNTLLMSVQERTRQIGMQRALGMHRKDVFITITLEALILGVVGALTAMIAAIGIGIVAGPEILKGIGLDLPGLQLFRFEPLSLAVVLAVVSTASLAASLLPALRAARLDPLDAMRADG